MRESLDEPVSVVWYYNAARRELKPHLLSWNNRDYRLGRVDFHHKTRLGNKLVHHFSMCDTDGQVYFKIALDTDNLQWTIEEYMLASEMSLEASNNAAQ